MELPDGYEIKEGYLYAGEDKLLFLKNNETFSEWTERLGIQFGRAMMPPDAYIDTKGVWHDDNDAWGEFEKKMMSGKFDDMPENPMEAAQEVYLENYEKFMDDELQDDDCFVILDCILYVYKFAIYNFCGSLSDVIHSTNPFHLIFCFELFGDTFLNCHNFNQLRKGFFGITVELEQIII